MTYLGRKDLTRASKIKAEEKFHISEQGYMVGILLDSMECQILGNGQFIRVLFIMPRLIAIHGHRSEIFTLVSEMHENVDLVFGIRNIFELEGIINS